MPRIEVSLEEQVEILTKRVNQARLDGIQKGLLHAARKIKLFAENTAAGTSLSADKLLGLASVISTTPPQEALEKWPWPNEESGK